MRPRRADTSEPAWTKRKMLSMKRRTSWPWSRKYSAVLARDVVDQLLDEHRLADAGAAEEADLAALHVGRDQVDHLDPRLEDLDRRLEVLEARRVAVDRPALHVVRRVLLVDRIAD